LATRAEYRVILRRGITKTEFPIWGGSSALAAAVEAGDTITVEPPARNRIVVMGEVRNPGEIIAKPGTSLLSAIAQAGGVTGEGNASQTLVYRGGEPILVDAELNVDPKRAVGFELQDGDTIVVRRNERVLYIFGEVQHQGRIAYPVGRTLHVTDALALAGGLGQNGTLRRVYLARPGADGHYRVTRFNLDEFIKDGRVAANPELEPGDVLLFGQPRQTVLAAITQVIGSLLFVEAISGAAGIRTTLP
jgi:polysaccharide export outer membrane protein